MVPTLTLAAALMVTLIVPQWPAPPIVIAHRGASGHRPEHTLEAYRLSVAMGAHVIEPDLVITRDGVLVARHENEIGGTTDVADKFPARRTTKTIDGRETTGWFTEDFTLAELRTLRAKERLAFRSHAYDGQFMIPTFDEVLALAAEESKGTGRTIGVYPELKHPTYFRAAGVPLEDRVLAALATHGLTEASSPVFIQSFEPESLEYLRTRTRARLVLLLQAPDAVTPAALTRWARFANGVGLEKKLVIPVNDAGVVGPATSVVADAHAAGLFVHVWTLRPEPQFLPAQYRGDLAAEARELAALGVDGLFTDVPDVVVNALQR